MIPVGSTVRARIMGLAHARALFLFLPVLAVGACAQLNRLPAVGIADTDRASVAGISDARFLPSDTAALAAFGRHLHEQGAMRSSATTDTRSLLAISGGGDSGVRPACWRDSRKAAGAHPSKSSPVSARRAHRATRLVGREYDPLLADMYATIDQTDIFEKRPIVAGLLLASQTAHRCISWRNMLTQLVRELPRIRRGRARDHRQISMPVFL
jgi:hypothetical protein